MTESGLGCPDWPLCHGRIIPAANAATLIEYTHRLVASLVGMLVLALAIIAWRRYRTRAWIFWPALVGLVMVIAQSILGGAAVLTELESYVVMIHMAMAQALLACFALVCLDAWRGLSLAANKVDGRAALSAAAALGVYLLILTGSYVALTGASGACNQWPLCQGGKLFVVAELPLVHVAHRFASTLTLVLLAAAAWGGVAFADAEGREVCDAACHWNLRRSGPGGCAYGLVGPADGPAGSARSPRHHDLGRPDLSNPPPVYPIERNRWR